MNSSVLRRKGRQLAKSIGVSYSELTQLIALGLLQVVERL
jgi:uncharacterized protein YidB (DUF937 family)